MTTQSNKILLGNYKQQQQPFYVYIINNQIYYCIQDMNYLFFNEKLTTRSNLIKQTFLHHQNDFIKNKKQQIFINTKTLIIIARYFNMYCLAELCKLSIDEILGNVAEPILNFISCENWIKVNNSFIVERGQDNYDALNGDEWLFISSSSFQDMCFKENNHYRIISKIEPPKLLPATDSNTPSTAILYQWLSSNINQHNNDPSMIQTLISAAKVKKQQQAIIETRQRQAAFSSSIIPPLPTTTRVNKKQKLARGNKHHSSSHHIAGNNITTTTTPDSFPPSPPSTTTCTSRKRKSLPQGSVETIKKQKTTTTTTTTTTRTREGSYQQYILNHGNDNLNLLATQATQMRGLPISPEVSPSPPPYYSHHQQQPQHRLPSIQVMLSELNYHHSNSSRIH